MKFCVGTLLQNSLIIAAKFDGDVHSETCRLAFYGRITALVDPARPQEMQQMKVFKVKAHAFYACHPAGAVGPTA